MSVEATIPSEEKRRGPKLGEELPIFCERCGYSLHGATQIRCDHCTILQFHCPECGHHQPINTLRPAAQTILGRLRAGWLVFVVFFKLNLLGWGLFAWVAMGAEYSYRYDWMKAQQIRNQTQNPSNYTYIDVWTARGLDLESVLAFGLYGLAFGLIPRMALLRWRRGWLVGVALAVLAIACIALGVWIQSLDRDKSVSAIYYGDFSWLMALAFLMIVLGASVIWPIWTLLVRAFLPRRTSESLLNW
jgi:hypothetical protein